MNAWYDFGEGTGGNLIDFGSRYFQCPVREWLPGLAAWNEKARVMPVIQGDNRHLDNRSGKIEILDDRDLEANTLLRYLRQRQIPLPVARMYCREVDFRLYGKIHTVIGFANNAGGYELRSAHFKGSSSPKDMTFLDRGQTQVAVFEGFFNFLSYAALTHRRPQDDCNILVLNSLSFLCKARSCMERHRSVRLYLDHDQAGQQRTAQALLWSHQYADASSVYEGFNDFNAWLQAQGTGQHITGDPAG